MGKAQQTKTEQMEEQLAEEAQITQAEVDAGKKTPVDLKKKNAQQTKTEQMEEKLAEETQIAQAEVDAGKKTPVDLKKKMAQQTKTEQMKEKLAEPTKEEESIMVDDTHQLASKEDLFAAISDTSLKSCKKLRQRRKSKPVEE